MIPQSRLLLGAYLLLAAALVIAGLVLIRPRLRTAADLMAMSPEDFGRFLERTGMAERVRRAVEWEPETITFAGGGA